MMTSQISKKEKNRSHVPMLFHSFSCFELVLFLFFRELWKFLVDGGELFSVSFGDEKKMVEIHAMDRQTGKIDTLEI